MSKHQTKLTCFYCDAIFHASRSSMGDHFPLPRRYGGVTAVPCCRECYSLKDRISLDDWNGTMIAKVLADFPKFSRETRIFLAKTMCAVQDANAYIRNKEKAA